MRDSLGEKKRFTIQVRVHKKFRDKRPGSDRPMNRCQYRGAIGPMLFTNLWASSQLGWSRVEAPYPTYFIFDGDDVNNGDNGDNIKMSPTFIYPYILVISF
ncbi:MAG: hypothetical protein EBE86_002730 [Hormoscilla sp. GUM202]|nr:hypothetical protein [Hormoscilla sp. GUM202]